MDVKSEIKGIVDRETKAWDTKDVDLLLSIFHPDFVWVWPKDENSHDPADWEISLGKFQRKRWKNIYQTLFDENELIHNKRRIVKIKVSKEKDGAFAVVDIDTLWRGKDGKESNWKGRVCKVYSKTKTGWKITMHTGVLRYPRDKA